MVIDESGKRGWVLGFTDSGTWAEVVSERVGTTRYEFVSRTYGREGTKYRVFSRCSA